MKIYSKNVKNNYLDPDFGGYGKKINENGRSNFSPHLEWEKVPNAKSYALEMVDYDASNFIGFPIIHWLVANITDNYLNEGESLKSSLLQGANSLAPYGILPEDKKVKTIEEASIYTGPKPRFKDHDYIFRIYALDINNLDLKKGFGMGEFYHAIKNHIIDSGMYIISYAFKDINKK